jgi:hypothetical protein
MNLLFLIFGISIIVLDASVYAANSAQIPATAVHVFNEATRITSYNSSQGMCQSARRMVEDNITSRCNTYNCSYNCQIVYKSWDRPVSKSSLSYRGGINRVYTLDLDSRVYCESRSLQQKQIMSLQRTCEKDPKPECFSKEFLEYLGTLKPTTYVDVNMPACR